MIAFLIVEPVVTFFSLWVGLCVSTAKDISSKLIQVGGVLHSNSGFAVPLPKRLRVLYNGRRISLHHHDVSFATLLRILVLRTTSIFACLQIVSAR